MSRSSTAETTARWLLDWLRNKAETAADEDLERRIDTTSQTFEKAHSECSSKI
jgi:hypothetical protein